jgi:redox-sensing transcriptional repressor
MSKDFSDPSVARLCLICRLLEEMEAEGIKTTYSKEIGERIGANAHSVRKDLSIVGDLGNNLSGYEVSGLKSRLFSRLGLDRERNACIVGLGRLGSAILRHQQTEGSAFRVVAGFDSDINRLELLESTIDVFPAYMIEEIAASRGIELAILAVPKSAAQKISDRLFWCGIKGIINFAPVVVKAPSRGVFVRNIDLVTEMRILSASLSLDAKGHEDGDA